MTKQVSNDATLTTPVDMTKDQVAEMRRVLREMGQGGSSNRPADRAIDAEKITARSHVRFRG